MVVLVDLVFLIGTVFPVAERMVLELEEESGFAVVATFDLEDGGLALPALIPAIGFELVLGVALLLDLVITGVGMSSSSITGGTIVR